MLFYVTWIHRKNEQALTCSWNLGYELTALSEHNTYFPKARERPARGAEKPPVISTNIPVVHGPGSCT
jgi:hypothetical protein